MGFMMTELDYHFANMTLNFTSYQLNENTTKYWAMTASSITYMSGNNPFFPNTYGEQVEPVQYNLWQLVQMQKHGLCQCDRLAVDVVRCQTSTLQHYIRRNVWNH